MATRRSVDERLAEIAQNERKLRVEKALLDSPALQDVKKARAALDRALEADPKRFPAGSKVADAYILLVGVFEDIAKGAG